MGRPLSAVRVSALGEQILVKDDDTVWDPNSGQLQIDFDVADVADAVSIETADDALFLMEHYGVPDFVDLPGFHKYLDGERTGHSPHSPPEYLAAALMFRLEQLHPEL